MGARGPWHPIYRRWKRSCSFPASSMEEYGPCDEDPTVERGGQQATCSIYWSIMVSEASGACNSQ